MKSLLKKYGKNKHIHLPFSQISDGVIECQGIILKRLNRRIRRKKLVLEYYKCQNSYTRNKLSGPCKFSGKLQYYMNSKAEYLEVIKKHSSFCLNKEGNNVYIQKNVSFPKQEEEQGSMKINTLPFEHCIYSNKIPKVTLSVQIHQEDSI